MRFDDLIRGVDQVREALGAGCSRTSVFDKAIHHEHIRQLIDWQVPQVDDMTDVTGARSGAVQAVRLDLLSGGIGLKQPVVGALLVRAAVRSERGRRPLIGVMDGGNVNTGMALGYFAKRFDLKARLVMSEFFPEDILEYLRHHSDGRLETVVAPHYGEGRERDFYRHLCVIARDRRLSRGFACLWHAKHGGLAIRALGNALAARIEQMPDAIVLVLGAGATLEGLAMPIRERFGNLPRIIVVEHEMCPLVEIAPGATSQIRGWDGLNYAKEWLRNPPAGIPHGVMGPHYDELNPCLDRSVLHQIDGVVRYDEDAWKSMASQCRSAGLSVGNSSAVNLLVARHLADEGLKVLTFLYEPCRDYYLAEGGHENAGAVKDRHLTQDRS